MNVIPFFELLKGILGFKGNYATIKCNVREYFFSLTKHLHNESNLTL